MAKSITISRFDGGVVNNGRTPNSRFAKAVANFNILSDPFRLVPYVSSEDGNSSADTDDIRNFTLGDRGGTSSLFGLGVNGSAQPAVFYRDVTDLGDATWSNTANNSNGGTASADRSPFFIYYPNQDKVYFWSSTTSLEEYDPDAPSTNQSANLATSGTITPTSFTRSSNGILHSKDDIVYVGIDNYIIKKNGSAAWADALTLPVGSEVVSLCEFGNYLAIGTRQADGIGQCQVYLWDRDGTLVTVSENISWGDEDLRVLEEVEGELIGISITSGTSADTNEQVFFRRYVAGAGAVKFLEFDTGFNPTVDVQVPRSVFQKYRGRLYFMMTATLHGAVRSGVWSIGRNPQTREWTLVHERTPNNDTALDNDHALRGFFNLREYVFQSFEDPTGTFDMTKTSDQEAYTATSYLETVVNPGMDTGDFFRRKRLKSVSLHFERLPASGVASVKFRVDSATAWSSITALLSESTDNAVFKEATRFDTNGGSIQTNGREFEFRIESTGGAVITGLSYEYELLPSLRK